MPKHSFSLHIPHVIKGEPVAIVAGGAGFLGSHLCEKLLASCRVICIDNLATGKRENLSSCLLSEKFTFIQYDIANQINDLIRKKVDYIFHVAGVDEVEKREQATLEDLLLNTYGTRNLLEKTVHDHAKFLLVSTLEHEKSFGETINTAQARFFSENLTREYIDRFGIDGRIIRLGHLFGPRMPLSTQNPLSIIIKDLMEQQEVVLANDELTRVYPVFIADCVDSILEAMFGSETKGKIYNLIPWHSITLRELSKLFQTSNPNLIFRFDQAGRQIKLFAKEHFDKGATIAITPTVELEKQLKETMLFFQKGQKEESEETNKEKPRLKKKPGPMRFMLLTFFAAALFFTTILPLLFLATTTAVGIISLNKTLTHVESGNFEQVVGSASVAKGSFNKAQGALKLLSYHFSLVGKVNDYDNVFLLLKSGEDAGKVALHLSSATTYLGEFFSKSIDGKGLEAKPSLDRAIGELNAAAAITPLLEKELAKVVQSSLPSSLNNYVSKRQSLLAKYSETIVQTKTLAALLPDLLGFEDKRVYLFLFQNNMELRPTGGFIGSYAIATVEKGSLNSFDVFDVYDADGQLRGHVEPPGAIRKYLNQPNWFLRDSNWDPDYKESAAQAAWFLEKEVGISPHGVIAIDVSFAQFLLESLGPVSLADYKETITADNLFEKAETHSEIGFFPGSTQKKDFLGALARRVIDRLLHDKNVSWFGIVSALKKGIEQKHVLFSFNNPFVQQVLNLNNWSGAILSFPKDEGKFNDYRMIVEANLGVNKANYYLKRKVNDEIIIGKEGIITGALSINYTNDGPNAWPGGNYVNYLRVLFPKQTKLTAVEIDGKEVSLQTEAGEDGFEVEEATQSGKSSFGGLISVAPRTSKLITFLYELEDTFPILPGSTKYSYVFQKQPGMREDLLSVSVNYPQALKIQDTNAQVFKEKQLVTLSTDLSEDRLFEVEFLR